MKSIYFSISPIYGSTVVVMLPKRRGEGFLKSPCSRFQGFNNDLVDIVDVELNAKSFEGYGYILYLSYSNIQNPDVMKESLTALAKNYYREDCKVECLDWDQLFEMAEKENKNA